MVWAQAAGVVSLRYNVDVEGTLQVVGQTIVQCTPHFVLLHALLDDPSYAQSGWARMARMG